MDRAVIQVEGLGKRYRRNVVVDAGLRHALTRALKAPLDAFKRTATEEFWALKDVSLEVREGEVLGLIGRNGAGKTTLLKILSRITQPTTGWAEIHGRVGSLLEVGTGFHPELTGRENTFLSGAILGMSKSEISRKFDEIVAFAELEQFIDTPVKHYSSGMYVRLAFAVAAHLEPEILFVDEVLAVGDITFQKKCLGKMQDVAHRGRTVIVVSHSMAAINSLCTRSMLLERGKVTFEGPTDLTTARYYAESLKLTGNGEKLGDREREGNGKALFQSIRIEPRNSVGETLEAAYPGCDLNIEIELKCETSIVECLLAVVFYDSNGYRIIDTNTAQQGEFLSLSKDQRVRATFLLKKVLLRPGRYFVGLWLGRHLMETVDHIENAVAMDIAEGEESGRHTIVYPGVYLCQFEKQIHVY
jgi:lipopolysaccharide transport system ATP-binding protein